MAWFPCNIGGGGPSGIANILKGTSNPASSIGDNGQLYLKYADLSLREYIEVGSTAGPYINTGFYWSSDCEFEIKAKWTGTPANNTAFFGAYSPNQDTDVQVYNGNTLFYVGGSGSGNLSIDTNDHIYKATQSELLLDGTNVGTPNWSRVPTSLEVSIFTMQQHSPAINARIYYIKIWKNGELHKYFIPAINNATNEIGMFEAVNGEFYSNDGTGSFDISSSVISDMPSRPILSSFAKVDNAWQDLIGTDIDDILAGGSKYIKTTGSFTSGASQWAKVEVNCGFKPDLVMVDMEFGNGYTRATYLSTAWYEETDHPISVWDLRPMENVIYAITPESVGGETGITDLTDTGFKYRVNGYNTQGKACTYTAIKFDAESEPTPVAPFEKEVLHSIVQDQSGSSVPVSVTFTKDYQIAFICGLIADNVYTGAISVNALGGASELYGLSGNRYASGGIAIRLPSNKTLTGYFPYSDGGAYYDIFGAIGMSRLPSEYEIGATIDVSNISIELSKVYDHIVVFVGMDSTDSNSITLAMNGTSIPLTVESDKFSRYSYHASQELTSDSITLNFTYSGGTVADNTIVVFAYNE